jgi:hypothetical protein
MRPATVIVVLQKRQSLARMSPPYILATKMNNNFVLVDEVQKEAGGTATIFVRSGDEFVRVATNV